MMVTAELLKHKFVVFCEDHYNPLGAVRSLGEAGITPDVILVCHHKPRLIVNSRYVGAVQKVGTIDEGYDYLLGHYAETKDKTFVITCSDDIESYLDMHYDELKDHFFFFDGGSQGQITRIMAKNEMCRLAVECGLDIPKTEELRIGELPKSLNYPVMTKSVISTVANWKNNVHICQNEQELLEAYKEISGERINVQEFIVKKNELCIDGLSINGGEEIYMPIQSSYIRFSDKSYGNYILFELFKEHDLYEKIHTLFRKTRFSGIFSIEFLRDRNDHFYFLEINFRNSTWSYAHTVEGVNLPLIWAKSVLAGHLDTSDVKIKKDTFTAMVEDSDFRESVVGHKVSLRQWIRDVRNCDCLFIHNKKDPKPFRRFILSELVRLTKKFVFRIKS
jgi:D-aspartate ligase